MKLSKVLSRIIALLCIVKICLLTLASVSPQIHGWIFHGGHFAGTMCPDVYSVHTESLDASKNHGSQPDVPEDPDNFCPVMLFQQGVTFAHEPVVGLPERYPVVVSITIESDTFRTNHSKGAVQARAPPIS